MRVRTPDEVVGEWFAAHPEYLDHEPTSVEPLIVGTLTLAEMEAWLAAEVRCAIRAIEEAAER